MLLINYDDKVELHQGTIGSDFTSKLGLNTGLIEHAVVPFNGIESFVAIAIQ